MCEYCDIEKYEKVDYGELVKDLDYGDYTTLRMEYLSNRFSIFAHGDDCAGIEINYCPFCGRKLEEK